MRGTVKWFGAQGYGFIAPHGGGKDVFFHHSEVKRAGLGDLDAGDVVSFEIAERNGRPLAIDLRMIERAPRTMRTGGWDYAAKGP